MANPLEWLFPQFFGPGTGGNPISSWLKSAGADIGSGIESGLVAVLKDLWGVIVGPLEIIAGTVLALAMIAFIFRNQLAEIAGTAAKAALA